MPVVLAWLLGRGRRREALEGAPPCSAVLLIGVGAAVAVSPDGAVDALRYHLERPVQIESVRPPVLLGLDGLGLGEAVSVSSHRSDGLHDRRRGRRVGALALVLVVALIAALAARGDGDDARRRLVLASLAAARRSPCSARCSRRSS